MRLRILADDIIEAMQRGISLDVIREMGLVYEKLEEYSHWGYTTMIIGHQEIAGYLGIQLSVDDSLPRLSNEQTILMLEIRHRLTGHTELEIEGDSIAIAGPHEEVVS